MIRGKIFIPLLVLLLACEQPLHIRQRTAKNYELSQQDVQDSSILNLLEPYRVAMDTQMQDVIGQTDIPLTKAQPECLLGNFMADAQLMAARKIDKRVAGSVVNYGGIRLPYIAPGPITRGKMYELMPFDNMLTIVEIPGETLKQFCDHMAQAKGWPVSGIKFSIKDKTASDIFIDGKPLNEHIVYKIAVSDYLAGGGDRCDFLTSLRRRNTSIFVRDAMIEYVMQLQQQNLPLHPQIENRIVYAE